MKRCLIVCSAGACTCNGDLNNLLLEVSTGSRLHFGLMELCADQPMRYAGLGLMVAAPRLRLELAGTATRQLPEFQLDTEQRSKVSRVIERRQQLNPHSVFPERILLAEQLPLHHGLGGGTQLACAVAVALEVFDQQARRHGWDSNTWIPACSPIVHRTDDNATASDNPSAEQWLVQYAGRGLRSAVGLAGFLSGGLILDHGYSSVSGQIVGAASSSRPPASGETRLDTKVVRESSARAWSSRCTERIDRGLGSRWGRLKRFDVSQPTREHRSELPGFGLAHYIVNSRGRRPDPWCEGIQAASSAEPAAEPAPQANVTTCSTRP